MDLSKLTKEEINNIPTVHVFINVHQVYEGDLGYYFRLMLTKARNLYNLYHNARHMLHVVWLCYVALIYYVQKGMAIDLRTARNMLIAAIFHDWDHSGRTGRDDLELARAIGAMRQFLHPSDQAWVDEIEAMMRGTQFPYVVDVKDLTLCGKILRDADKSQALTNAWIQQIALGLSQEMGITALAMLKGQEAFLSSIEFGSEWAKDRFPPELIKGKIAEANLMVAMLEAA